MQDDEAVALSEERVTPRDQDTLITALLDPEGGDQGVLVPWRHAFLRECNRFIVLHLASGPGIIPAPVNVSTSGRDARAWVEVDLAAVVENARTVARVAGTRLLPVVKANAYGGGAVAVSRALEPLDPWGGSGERRVGEEGRSRGSADHLK